MAGLISPATLEQIRAANDIVDVIGSYLPLKRAGANFVALCPFHKEKSPSFNVNPHRQIFHCFGCHKGGDVFTFVREYENLSFVEAVKRLAERANIPLEFDQQPGQKQALALKESLWQIHEQIARRWQNALAGEAAGQLARDYLKKRGVTDEAVQLFRLGAAPEAWDDTVNWAKSKGYDLALVEQSGLIIRKEGTDRHYDRFRGRLMFPICDEQGRVIAFSGRVLSGDEKTAKYVNSPETPIFTKGKVFFGLDKSKRAILDAGFAIICEGQLDLIACYMAGVKNIVAPQGTAFTADHARILKRYVNEVVLCFDSDNAGQNAAVRVFDSLLASGLAIRVALVPEPHDPDSFIKERGGPAFQQLIAGAEGFFEFYLKRLCATNDIRADVGRKAVVQAMREAVWKTGDGVLMDTYAQKTALRLGVASDAVRAEFKKGVRAQPSYAEEPDIDLSAAPATEEVPPSPQEFLLLKILLECDEAAEWATSHLNTEWFRSLTLRKIIARRLELQRNRAWLSVSAFLSEFDEPGLQQTITSVLAGGLVAHRDGLRYAMKPMGQEPMKEFVGAAASLRSDYITRQLSALSQRVSHPDVSKEDQQELHRQQQELRAQKRQPL
ncbi:MAG: DNA primase [Verrucomicrobia bacterium]|nr:DNA primase [Verrucomicrobiota bacterium]